MKKLYLFLFFVLEFACTHALAKKLPLCPDKIEPYSSHSLPNPPIILKPHSSSKGM
jgi:hypothetical protein